MSIFFNVLSERSLAHKTQNLFDLKLNIDQLGIDNKGVMLTFDGQFNSNKKKNIFKINLNGEILNIQCIGSFFDSYILISLDKIKTYNNNIKAAFIISKKDFKSFILGSYINLPQTNIKQLFNNSIVNNLESNSKIFFKKITLKNKQQLNNFSFNNGFVCFGALA